MDADQTLRIGPLPGIFDTATDSSWMGTPMPSYAENLPAQHPSPAEIHQTGQQQQETVMPSIEDTEFWVLDPRAGPSNTATNSVEDLGNTMQQPGPSDANVGRPECVCGQLTCSRCERRGFVSPNQWADDFVRDEGEEFERIDIPAVVNGGSMEMGNGQDSGVQVHTDMERAHGADDVQDPRDIMLDPVLNHGDVGAQRWNSGPEPQTGYQQLPPPHTQDQLAMHRQHGGAQPRQVTWPEGFNEQISGQYGVGPLVTQFGYNAPLPQTSLADNQALAQARYAPGYSAPVIGFSPPDMPYTLHQPIQLPQPRPGDFFNVSLQDIIVQVQARQHALNRIENRLRLLDELLRKGEERIFEEYRRADRISAELDVIVGDMYRHRPRHINLLEERMMVECDARTQQVERVIRKLDRERQEYGVSLHNGVSNRA